MLLQVVLSQLQNMAQQAGHHDFHHPPPGEDGRNSGGDGGDGYHQHASTNDHTLLPYAAGRQQQRPEEPRNDTTTTNHNNNINNHYAADLANADIHMDKIRIALEATGGDVDLAASLYWDDYLATRQQEQRLSQPQPPRLPQPHHRRAPRRQRPIIPPAAQHDPAAAAPPPPPPQAPSLRNALLPANDPNHDMEEDDDLDLEWMTRMGRGPNPPPHLDPALSRQQQQQPASSLRSNLNHHFARHAHLHAAGPPPHEPLLEQQVAQQAAAVAAAAVAAAAAQQISAAQQPGGVVPAVGGGGRGPAARRPVAAGAAALPPQPPVPDHDGRVARLMAQAREAARQLEHPHQVLAARAFLAGESVSVSDDESGGVWKMVGGIVSSKGQGGLDEDDDDEEEEDEENESNPRRKRDVCRPRHKRRKLTKHSADEKDNMDIYEDGYMSDNDWVWETLSDHVQGPTSHPPTDLLWGIAIPLAERSSSPAAADDAAHPSAVKAAAAAAAVPPAPAENQSSNVIADDDADDPEGSGDGAPTTEKSGIPRTWLSAGFSLAECTTGLVLKPPTEDDLAYFAWQRQVSGRSTPRNALPPPYHCRAITAILSIVTALLYSDISVHNGDISCAPVKNPFAQLSEEERKREFESRLANALSTLLLIAAKSSVALKRRALRKHERSNDPKDRRIWQRLERKLHLCPTCVWETDSTTGEVRIPEGRDADRKIQISTSFTNIQDLKHYVLSNMKSFTSTGGVALFLETIMSIHGKSAVTRMVQQSRRQANLMDADTTMILCTCEERHKKKMEANPTFFGSSNARSNANATDTTPEGHNCISIELVSLLLTGRVYSTLQGWTTHPLGIGILSDVPGQVGKGLTRPDRPIWILRGPTCYSLLWLDGSTIQDDAKDFSKKERAGAVVKLKHWNCWYGQRNKTDMRMIQYTPEWKPPTRSTMLAGKKENHNANRPVEERKMKAKDAFENSKSLQLILERRKASLLAASEREGAETVNPETLVTRDELDRVVPNPDDQTFYPGKYTMWRYDFEDPPTNANSVDDRKVRAQQWRPFYKLSLREQLLVETKLGPKIKTILWTRWPRATVDKFEPMSPPPIV